MFTITTNGGYCKEYNDDTLQQSNEVQIQEEEYTIPGT